MANNPYVNKVEYAGNTIMDISDTTATEEDVLPGKVFYAGSGKRSIGSLGTATQEQDGLMSAEDKIKLDDACKDIDDINTRGPIMAKPVSGDVASFEDLVGNTPMDIKIAINPVQDLHGYDNPWPACGGKNLLNRTMGNESGGGITYTYNSDGTVSTTGTASSNTSNNIGTFTAKAGVTYVLNGTPTGAESGIYVRFHGPGASEYTFSYSANSTNDYKVEFTFEEDTTGYVDICIGNGKNVSGFTFKPMIRLASITDDTFAPYSNICPISGHTECNVTRTGKNLFPLYTGEPTTNRDITFTYNSDGSITVSGANTTPSSSSLSTTLLRGMRMLKPGTYKKEARKNGFYTYVQYVESSSSWKTVPGGGATFDEFEITQEIYDNYEIVIRVGVSGGTSYDSATTFYPYIYRDNETDLTWVSPARNTYEITFPTDAGTVYGGTLTVNKDGTGTLVVDKEYTTVNDNEWEYDSTYTRFKTVISGIKRGSTRRIPFICSAFVSIDDGRALSNVPDNSIYAAGTTDNIYIMNTTYTDATLFKTAFADVQIVYPLNTPVTYNLTALQVIETLKGVNNVLADCGEILYAKTVFENYKTIVYDGLDSTSTDDALSAKQGKVLNDTITKHEFDSTQFVTLEYYVDFTTPCDGYIRIRTAANELCGVNINGFAGFSASNGNDAMCFFRKGTVVRKNHDLATVIFIPLV